MPRVWISRNRSADNAARAYVHTKIADITSQKLQIPYWTRRFPSPELAPTPIRARNPKKIIHAVKRRLIRTTHCCSDIVCST